MEEKIEIHAYHGWGFDASFWNNFRKGVSANILFKPADRGYFAGDFEPEFDKHSTHRVLLLHSYGVHWCPLIKMEQANVIIVLNGFNSFHPLKYPAKSRSKKVLKGMEVQFKKYPDQVLNAFYKNCFGDFEFEPMNMQWINNTLLRKDLSALNKVKLKLNKRINAEWLFIHSDNDQIVQGSRVEEFKRLTSSLNYMQINHGVHALPATNAKDCIEIISSAFPILRLNEKY